MRWPFRRFWRRQNLTTFIDQGDKAQLYADVNSAVTDAMARKLPLLALCAAPLVLGIAARDAGLERRAADFLAIAKARP